MMPFNPNIQFQLQNKLFSVFNDIENNKSPWIIEAANNNGQQNYQFWEFSFQAQLTVKEKVKKISKEQNKFKIEEQEIDKEFPFGGRLIKGTLVFPNDYPTSAPKFIFDTVQGKTIKHINIYGDNVFCVPLFTNWKPGVSELEILQTIEYIFHHPNVGEGDAPANPIFSQLPIAQQYQEQYEQAKQMMEFEQ